MAVCDGCPNNNFEGDRPPDGNDDPCDTSQIGIFCTGSYWLYNPDLSVDTDLYGDCPRLFIRIGDQCGVNEWLELSTQDAIVSADAPTDTDCCPAGTLWIRPVALSGLAEDLVYLSYADFSVEPPICRWCLICGEDAEFEPESVSATVASEWIFLDDLDGDPTTDFPLLVVNAGIAPLTVSITNPSATRNMSVLIDFSPYAYHFGFERVTAGINADYGGSADFFVDGVAQHSSAAVRDATSRVVDLDAIAYSFGSSPGVFATTRTIGPGVTITASMEAIVLIPTPHNGDVKATMEIGSGAISMLGSVI